MDLHYSQTTGTNEKIMIMFHYLMDLHYSQTGNTPTPGKPSFHYLMDLHYSQTPAPASLGCIRFTTLWIYTILKRTIRRCSNLFVSLPYGFTLFSNEVLQGILQGEVSLPYGFTLFSNYKADRKAEYEFHYLMDLHYSQT